MSSCSEWAVLRLAAEYARLQESCAAQFRAYARTARDAGASDLERTYLTEAVWCDGAAAGARGAAHDILTKLRRSGL